MTYKLNKLDNPESCINRQAATIKADKEHIRELKSKLSDF